MIKSMGMNKKIKTINKLDFDLIVLLIWIDSSLIACAIKFLTEFGYL